MAVHQAPGLAFWLKVQVHMELVGEQALHGQLGAQALGHEGVQGAAGVISLTAAADVADDVAVQFGQDRDGDFVGGLVLRQAAIVLLAVDLRPWGLHPAVEGPLLLVGTVATSLLVVACLGRWRVLRPWLGMAAVPRQAQVSPPQPAARPPSVQGGGLSRRRCGRGVAGRG